MKAPGINPQPSSRVTVELSDPALLRRLAQEAKRAGHDGANAGAFISAAVEKATREHYGLESDLSKCEVAARLNCHPNTIKAYFKQGRFPGAYYRSNGDRTMRIPLADVAALKRLRSA